MAPKVIENDIFKHRKEIDKEVIEKLIVRGGPVAVRETLTDKFQYNDTEKVAAPTIVIAGDGRISGVKWTILGKPDKKVTIKGTQLWPDCEEEVHINLEVPEFDNFQFYNKCRNVSGWIDSSELTWTVLKKVDKKKKAVVITPTNYETTGVKGFSVRMGVLPISSDTANLTLAILPLSKAEIKKRFGDKYSKTYTAQVALTMGENNVKAMAIKLAVKEVDNANFGMGILPIIEDVRSDEQISEKFPTSLEIRKAMFHFLRGCQGFNNKIPRTLQDALTEGPDKWAAIEPEYIWPETHNEENDQPVEESGTYNTLHMDLEQMNDVCLKLTK